MSLSPAFLQQSYARRSNIIHEDFVVADVIDVVVIAVVVAV